MSIDAKTGDNPHDGVREEIVQIDGVGGKPQHDDADSTVPASEAPATSTDQHALPVSARRSDPAEEPQDGPPGESAAESESEIASGSGGAAVDDTFGAPHNASLVAAGAEFGAVESAAASQAGTSDTIIAEPDAEQEPGLASGLTPDLVPAGEGQLSVAAGDTVADSLESAAFETPQAERAADDQAEHEPRVERALAGPAANDALAATVPDDGAAPTGLAASSDRAIPAQEAQTSPEESEPASIPATVAANAEAPGAQEPESTSTGAQHPNPRDLAEQSGDEVLDEVDPADQPTEIALAGSDLADQQPVEGHDAPYTWNDSPTLPDPAYAPAAIPNEAEAEPWRGAPVSPDYEPPAPSYGSLPGVSTGVVTADATGEAPRHPAAEYPLSPYPDYPGVVYPVPAKRNNHLPLVGILAAVLLATLVVFLLARNTFTAPPPTKSATLYASAMTTPSSTWPNDKECYFGKDGYHITGASNCYYSGAEYQDATVTVAATVLKGPSDAAYGIAFRRPGPNNFYVFLVTTNGDWFLVKDNAVLQRAVSSPVIKKGIGATNVLAVRMQGSHFTFFANGTQLGELTDDTYSTGTVGLAGDVNADVVYRNFSVTQG